MNETEAVFDALYQRAKSEPCMVNIFDDTIWLHDCGFSVNETTLSVRIKTAGRTTDNDVIATYEIEKPKWFGKNLMFLKFKNLVEEIKKQAEKDKKAKLDDANFKEDLAKKNAVKKLLGL